MRVIWASEEREEAIEGDKYSDESGTDPDSDLSDDELLAQDTISPSIRSMAYITVFICSGSG